MRMMLAITLVACAGAAPSLALPAPDAIDWVAADAPADQLAVRVIEAGGYRGAEIAATMPAGPQRVVAALTDFDGADGHRAFAERHRVVERGADRVVARWDFKGRLGIAPSVELVFEIERGTDQTLIRFSQPEPVFGLAAFFGEYRVAGDPGDPDRSLLLSRVFIDSGLPFVGASDADLADGLRADVRLIRAWLQVPPRVSSAACSEPGESLPSTR